MKLLTFELPMLLTLHTRNPECYPNYECPLCRQTTDDAIHWLICLKNETKIEDILNDTMNKTARKEDSPLSNQENYITKFIKTYTTKGIPLTAITPDYI